MWNDILSIEIKTNNKKQILQRYIFLWPTVELFVVQCTARGKVTETEALFSYTVFIIDHNLCICAFVTML